MNAGRYAGAVIAVWIVRVAMNWLFYGMYMSPRMTAATAHWSGAFREVVPAYIIADLLFSIVFVWVWVKVCACFGGGTKGGAYYGFLIGLLAAVLPGVYSYYSVTYMSGALWVTDIVYGLVAGVVIGIVVALVYRCDPVKA